jgi:hypothetical protein
MDASLRRVMQIDHRAFPPQITGSISEVLHANRWALLGSPSLRTTLNCLFVWLTAQDPSSTWALAFTFGFGFGFVFMGLFPLR